MVADRSLVLIVSRDPAIVQKLSPLLQQAGCESANAETGSEALDLHQRLQPHLMVVDALLSDQDQGEIWRKLQALVDAAGTPVVIIGAAGQDQQAIDRALAAGVADYIDRSVQAQWTLLGRRIQYLITSRVVSETLDRDRALLRTLIDNVPDYIFAKDRAGRFLVSNEAHAQAVKVSSEALVGKTAFDLFPPHLAAQFQADDEALMQSGEALINADRLTVDSSGADRRVLTTKVPLKDRQGQVIGLVGISRDVTEYKQTQEALTQEKSLLRTLIDNLPDNIFVKDTQGRIIIDNLAHSTLLGLSGPEEAVGKTDFDFFPKELASQYFADEQAVIQSGQPLINREEQTVDPAGIPRWLLTSKMPLRNSQGEITGIVGINRDITDRKKLEEVLKKGAGQP